MKAQVGGYARADDLAHAVELLARSHGSGRLLAGGQSLVAALNMGLSAGDMLVDIGHLTEIRGVTMEDGNLVIGALTRHAEIAANPQIAEAAPLLSKAAPLVAHEAIRTRGTLGGSLAHADPAAEYPACAVALDATMRIEGPHGCREVPAKDFFKGVFETDLRPGEILTALVIPPATGSDVQLIRESARRSGDYAIAGLAVVRRAGRHSIAAFGVGGTPVICSRAMEKLDAGDADAAVAAVGSDLDPWSDTQASVAYRRHLAGVLLRRIIEDMAGNHT